MNKDIERNDKPPSRINIQIIQDLTSPFGVASIILLSAVILLSFYSIFNNLSTSYCTMHFDIHDVDLS
ncbi:hypothetical protein ACN38_g12043 [Penicillium nordicum]|uniref:Uncharacterized protein n=1 Tax=Penicillium nordicum TaxID=229535 RepID=A0A0M9WAA8_9EURO|nr:hypothetical protein ACN38_g12043 [Penicillium nordicum]